jgi:cell division protein FtsN
MAARAQRRRGGLFVLIGFLSIIAVAFGAGVYAGRIWMARSVVTMTRVEPEATRRGAARGVKLPDVPPGPHLTFYQELTAPLTAPPPPPKPAKAPPPLLSGPAAAVNLPAPRPGEQAELLSTTTPRTAATVSPRFTVQVASYRVRPQAEAMRASLASAGHDARIVEADAHGPVYRVQVGEFPTREAARALAARLSGERSSVAPIVTPR